MRNCTFCRFCAKISVWRLFVSLFLCVCKVWRKLDRFLKENHENIWRNEKKAVPLQCNKIGNTSFTSQALFVPGSFFE